jgi:hypothetical protein
MAGSPQRAAVEGHHVIATPGGGAGGQAPGAVAAIAG